MSLTLADMRTWVRQRASLTTDDNTQIDVLINEALRDFARDAQTSPDVLDFTLSNGQSVYRLDDVVGVSMETHRIEVVATGGTLTYTWSGQTTGAVAYNATAATWVTALEALSNIAVGEVSVTVGDGDGSQERPIYVDITHQSRTNVVAATVSGASLTGPNAAASVSTIEQGGRSGVLKLIALGVSSDGDNPTSIDIVDELELLDCKLKSTEDGRPSVAAVRGLSSLEVWPAPDSDMTLSGVYVPRPAALVLDTHVPEIPDEYHRTVVYRAIQLALEWDGQPWDEIQAFEQRYEQGVGLARQARKRIAGNRPKQLRPHVSHAGRQRAWSFRRQVGLD